LHNRLDFLEDEIDLIASMELINNYQNRQNYNAILFDEEKKTIVSELLQWVESSFYNSGVIYDKNGDIVVCVFRENDRYHLNFISYEEGKQILYSRSEDEKEFYKVPFSLPFYITNHHKEYYTQPELRKEVVLTYQQKHDSLYITGHNSVFDPDTYDKKILHIQLNTMFDRQYLSNLSKKLRIEVQICTNTPITKIS